MSKKSIHTRTFGSTALQSSWLNTLQSEDQTEAELRSDRQLGDGVGGSTHWTPSINGVAVDFAAGDLFFRGKRYDAADYATCSFDGESAGTYYVYMDDATGAVLKSTVHPAATAGFVLCSIVWNGTTTLSSLTDLRVIGFVGSAQLQLKTISGSEEVVVPAGMIADLTVNHSDLADFALPLELRAWADEPMVIRPTLQRSNGDRTYGSQFCLELENEAGVSYSTTLHWERTGLVL